MLVLQAVAPLVEQLAVMACYDDVVIADGVRQKVVTAICVINADEQLGAAQVVAAFVAYQLPLSHKVETEVAIGLEDSDRPQRHIPPDAHTDA